MSVDKSLIGMSISDMRDGMGRGDFSAVDLVDAHISATESVRRLSGYITETPELARKMALASDARRAKKKIGALEGIPLAIKDVFCTKDVPTTAASRMLDGFIPTYESSVTANIWQAGAVMMGKSNMDEFAMGSSNITSYLAPPRIRGPMWIMTALWHPAAVPGAQLH